MRYLLALAALILASCTATIDRPQSPQVVYVRDEAAIADAKVDGAAQAMLVSAVIGVSIVVLGSLAYAVTHTRHERPAQRLQPPVVQNITHNHLHIHGTTPAQVAVRKMLDEVQL